MILSFISLISLISVHSHLLTYQNNWIQKNYFQDQFQIFSHTRFTGTLFEGKILFKQVKSLDTIADYDHYEIISLLEVNPATDSRSVVPEIQFEPAVDSIYSKQVRARLEEQKMLSSVKKFISQLETDQMKQKMKVKNTQLISLLFQPLVILSENSDWQPVLQPRLTFSSISLKNNKIRKVIKNRQFQNLGFYSNLPIQFVDGQIYRFQGIITNSQLQIQKTGRINIIFLSAVTLNVVIACQNQIFHNLEFQLSCQMKNTGMYYMYIFIGDSGKYSPIQRKVLSNQNLIKSNFIQPSQPQPKGLRLQLLNNSLYALWDSNANLTNLTIYQINDGIINKKQYILSNNHKKFKIPFKDFDSFLPKTTFIQISHAKSMDGTLKIIFTKFTSPKDKISFEALDHAFDITDEKATISPELPWRIRAGQKFRFNLTVSEDIRSTVFITEPDSNLRKISLTIQNQQNLNFNTYIRAGTRLMLEISFSKPGTNIIEINNVNGSALINRPIYVGQGYPLIPDYKDLIPSLLLRQNISLEQIFKKYYSTKTQILQRDEPQISESLESKNTYVLVLINGIRKKYGSPLLYLDETLNKIAQNHTDDMVIRNYISHTNLQGERSKQRANKFKYSNLVGQNICKSNSLIENQLQLQRSGIHLENTINPIWSRVGIGINITSTDQYIITYLYSVRDLEKFPVIQSQLVLFKQGLIRLLLQTKQHIQEEDKNLSYNLQQWIESNREQTMMEYVSKRKGFGSFAGLSLQVNYTQDLLKRMKDSYRFDGYQNFTRLGLGLGINKQQGNFLQIVLVFT